MSVVTGHGGRGQHRCGHGAKPFGHEINLPGTDAGKQGWFGSMMETSTPSLQGGAEFDTDVAAPMTAALRGRPSGRHVVESSMRVLSRGRIAS